MSDRTALFSAAYLATLFSHPDLLLSRVRFVGVLLEAWETIATRHAFDDRGVFSRATLRILTSGLDWADRLAATSGPSAAMTAAMFVQMAAALVVAAGGGEQARRTGDLFIAAQVALAYVAAGAAKVLSAIWRQGRAMSAILSAEGYGIGAVAEVLERRPLLDAALGWSVMLWEVTFPAVRISPMPFVLGFLAIGGLFHIGCAVLMGLNRFVWAFVGCYPAVLVAVEYLGGTRLG